MGNLCARICAGRVTPVAGGKDSEGSEGILIKQANNLRDADGLLNGSDVYVSVRTGPSSSSWDSKVQSEKRSRTIFDTQNPVFQLAFQYDVRASAKRGEELHVRLFDKDDWITGNLLATDDFLGEMRVNFKTLLQQANNQIFEFVLTGSKAQGTISVMVGTQVAQALFAEVESELAGTSSASYSPLAAMTWTVSRLGIWFADRFNLNMTPAYAANMARLGVAWASEPKPVNDAVSVFTAARSNAQGEWAGPFLEHCITFSRHHDVIARLCALGEKLGTNNGNGSVERENFLGFQRLTSVCWPELKGIGFGYAQPCIGLGQPQEAHAIVRPLIVRLCGPHSYTHLGGATWLEEQANIFFAGRRRIHLPFDLKIWTAKLQHEVMLGLTLTEHEARDFGIMQSSIIISMGVPEPALPLLEKQLRTQHALKEKAMWLEKYKVALRIKLPQETAQMEDKELTLLSSCVMDALLFAGGVSIPTVLAYALAIPRSSWGEANLPTDFSLDDTDSHAAYVLEIIRRFSPVAGFAYTERSSGNTPGKRIFLDLLSAQRDKAVWGEDADEFKLRPLAHYHKFSVGFADCAISDTLGSANSHACPGKDFGMQSVFAFLKAYVRAARPYGGVSSLWHTLSADADESTGLRAALSAAQITVNCFSASSFVLEHTHGALSLASQDLTGLDLLVDIESSEVDEILHNPHFKSRNNLLYTTNANTQLFMRLVQLMFARGKPIPSSEQASNILLPKQDFSNDTYYAPFGGLKFIMIDEDVPPQTVVNFGKMIAITAAQLLPFETTEAKEQLTYWPSRAAAAADIDEGFGPYMPPYFREQEDFATDDATAALFTFGAGCIYFKAMGASTHSKSPSSAYEANIDFLSKYQTRGHWLRYGATAYFEKEVPGALPQLSGIWLCYCNKLIHKEDARWEHAKAHLRTSLGCALTLKNHLGQVHWIIANGLGLAARTELGVEHVLRRLLKQFYYCTAEINAASKQVLLPVNGFAHRIFAFSEESWPQVFADVFAEWTWKPFPQILTETGLSDEFLADWPYAADGMRVYNCMQTYVKGVLTLFYSSDAALLADEEVVGFWANFETQLDTPWRLPALSMESLVSLVTDLMFHVTASHELVGSLVEYVLTPEGLMSKLAPDATQADVQSTAQSLILIALTGLQKPPLLADWTHIFKGAQLQKCWGSQRQQNVIDLVRKFQVDLRECAEQIDQLNETRSFKYGRKFVAFNPRILETSVSL